MCSAAWGRQEGLQNQEVNVERFQTPPGRIPWDVQKARSMALISLTSFTFTLGRDPRTVRQKESPSMSGSLPPGCSAMFSQYQGRRASAGHSGNRQRLTLLGPGKKLVSCHRNQLQQEMNELQSYCFIRRQEHRY